MKTYTIKLSGSCHEIKVYDINMDAAEYWKSRISDIGHSDELSDYLCGNSEDDIPLDADFLEGEDEYEASSLCSEFTVINLPDCDLSIEDDFNNVEHIDTTDEEQSIEISWHDAEDLPKPSLIIYDYMKGLIFEGKISIDDEKDLDKSKIKIILAEQEQGDQLIGIFYEDQEIENIDFHLTGKGRSFEITEHE